VGRLGGNVKTILNTVLKYYKPITAISIVRYVRRLRQGTNYKYWPMSREMEICVFSKVIRK